MAKNQNLQQIKQPQNTASTEKFDFYSHIVGRLFPPKLQPYYYANHCLLIEAIRSRFASKQTSLCKNRLLWWEESIRSLMKTENNPQPIAFLLKKEAQNCKINTNLLQRIINYQLFDIERGDINTMMELEVYGENTRSLLLYLNLQLLQIDDQNAYKCASHIGRAAGIVDLLKKIKYHFIKQKIYMPKQLITKIQYGLHETRIWNSRKEGAVSQQFFDVILQVAGYAKRHIQIARKFDNLPKNTNRAFLIAVPTDYYLDQLEKANFNFLDEQLLRNSYSTVPYRVWKHARNGTF